MNTRALMIAGVIILAVGFLLGFVPQYQTASDLRSQLAARNAQAQKLEREAALAKARHDASLMYLELTRKNYGVTAQQATAFFDQIRGMVSDANFASVRGVLERILGYRDAVTAGIAQSDPAIVSTAQSILDELYALKL